MRRKEAFLFPFLPVPSRAVSPRHPASVAPKWKKKSMEMCPFWRNFINFAKPFKQVKQGDCLGDNGVSLL
uniref:hypothetical protein n=1 Tax=Prevotella sp. TaxID=59823 RepID=UPI003FEF9D64